MLICVTYVIKIVDPKGYPCGTILEAAKVQHGMRTGLVATSRITHATPASFSAHIGDRDRENQIAVQQIGNNPLGRTVDLMFGGGYCHFLPKSAKNSCRKDGRDLLKEARDKHGWNTVFYNNRTAFDNGTIELPVIALFADDVSVLMYFDFFCSIYVSLMPFFIVV